MVPESPSITCLTQRKIFAQRQIQRLIGYEQLIIHPQRTRPRTYLLNMCIDSRAICFRIIRNDLESLIGLKVNQDCRPLHHWVDLLRIENVEQDHLVAVEAKRSDSVHNRFRVLIKIRNHNCDAAPMERILKVPERLGKISPRAWY